MSSANRYQQNSYPGPITNHCQQSQPTPWGPDSYGHLNKEQHILPQIYQPLIAELAADDTLITSKKTSVFAEPTQSQDTNEDERLARKLQEEENDHFQAQNCPFSYSAANGQSQQSQLQQVIGSLIPAPPYTEQPLAAPPSQRHSLQPTYHITLHTSMAQPALQSAPSPQLSPALLNLHPAQSPQLMPQMDSRLASDYLEKYRQPPIPPHWSLPPIISTFYGSAVSKGVDWSDPVSMQTWRTVRLALHRRFPVTPLFQISMEEKGGHIRDKTYSWTMTVPSSAKSAKNKLWTYTVTRARKTNVVKSEALISPFGKQISCTYTHGPTHESLSFQGTDDRNYEWRSSSHLSTVNGSRYDVLRHALFLVTSNNGPEIIVADHTHWDGFVDLHEQHTGITCTNCSASPLIGNRWKCKTCPNHNICDSCRLTFTSVSPSCELTMVSCPDEALYIRSQGVDATMIVATLQVLKDWEMESCREERRKDPVGVEMTAADARMRDLGRVAYWRESDFNSYTGAEVGQSLGSSVG